MLGLCYFPIVNLVFVSFFFPMTTSFLRAHEKCLQNQKYILHYTVEIILPSITIYVVQGRL